MTLFCGNFRKVISYPFYHLSSSHPIIYHPFLGSFEGDLGAHDTLDAVVDFVNYWHDRTKLPLTRFVRRLGIGSSQFYRGRERYGMVNEHNGQGFARFSGFWTVKSRRSKAVSTATVWACAAWASAGHLLTERIGDPSNSVPAPGGVPAVS
jgi:hypothetical protein